nr:hypothetical protein [Ornithinibacillus contaminans]
MPGNLLGQFFGNQGGFPGGGFPGGGGQVPGFPGGGGQVPGFPGGGGQGPGFPGGGGQVPGFPGGGGQVPGFPGGGGQNPPTSPPPTFTPQQPQYQLYAIDPGGIRGCLYRFTYIWLNRDSFWFYPIYVGRNSIAGFRWRGNRWVYYGVDLDRVESFQCY